MTLCFFGTVAELDFNRLLKKSGSKDVVPAATI